MRTWHRRHPWWYEVAPNGIAEYVINFDGRWTVPWSCEFYPTLWGAASLLVAINARARGK